MLFAGDISTLEDLVDPMSRREFMDCYINQLPVFVHGGSAMRAAGLVDVAEVSALVQQGLHPEGRISLLQNGKRIPAEFYRTRDARPRIDPSVVRRLLNGGASLVVNGIDEALPKIGDLAHALELEFSSNVWANAYVTLNEGGAFDVHFDDHDVIVLQISGSKRWRLFGLTEEYPIDPGKSLGEPPAIEQQADVLSAGEVLFIPRGVWHRAEVVDSPSFHITFGVSGMTGLDLVRNALEELRAEALFRKYLPRVGGGELLSEHEKRLKADLHDWIDRISGTAFLDQSDSTRRSRSRPVLWDHIQLGGATKLWLAARRIPSADVLKELENGSIRIGAEDHRFDSTACAILKIAFARVVLSFDELVILVRAAGIAVSDAELSSTVVQLVESGVLNAESM
jgi:ribosomal protein L16 Arg81 hydroxylase